MDRDSAFPAIKVTRMGGIDQRTSPDDLDTDGRPNFSTLEGLYPSQDGLLSRVPGKSLLLKLASEIIMRIFQPFDSAGNILIQTTTHLYAYTLKTLLGTATTAPTTISSTVQARWKDCYATSPRVRLTLRTNGEEETNVITPLLSMVKAGFVAPTVAPTVASAGAGNLTSGTFVAYRYVYASSRYPFVDNAVTGGAGQLWPRSNPSSASSVFSITGGNKQLTVTVTKTTRTDVDWIWVYRTALKSTSAEAQADADAGQMFYIAAAQNDGIAGTTSVGDNTVADSNELLELDNYPAPTMQFCIFDGTASWYGIGNFSYDYPANTSAGSSTVTLVGAPAIFSGRDGQTATFDSITSGGYDGKGSFYWKRLSATTGSLYSDPDLTSLVSAGVTSTPTTIHLKGEATTLYRSKPLNPFSWGVTDQTFVTEGTVTSVIRDPHLFVVKFGAGDTTAMSLVGDDGYLVLSFEQPVGMIRLALDQADSDAFALTAKDIDTSSGIGSHFSQVLARSQGTSLLSGVDSSNFDLISTGGDNSQPISDMVFQAMRLLYPSLTASRLFHSVYDAKTEITAFWIKTKSLSSNIIDTVLLLHGPTGRWSVMPDHQVSESATIFDPETKSNFTMLGMENGYVCTGFDTGTYSNIMEGAEWASGTLTQATNNVSMPNVLTLMTSITFVSGTTWTVDAVTGKSKVGIGILLSFYGIANALLGTGTVTAVTLVLDPLFGDFYRFTVTSGAAIGGALTYSVNAANANGLWMYFIPSSQTVGNYWIRLASGSSTATTHTWTPNYIYNEINQTGSATLTGGGPSLSGGTGFVGCIPCRHRRYFDLDEPTKCKGLTEAWATMDNVGTHYCRVFNEFSSTFVSGFRFQLTQQFQRVSSAASNAWVNKTGVPADLRLSFGFEILECGFNQYKNYNYVLQFRAS